VEALNQKNIVWQYEWDNPFDFEVARKWIDDYNTDLPHQGLNNLTPKQYFETCLNNATVLN